MRYFVLRDGGFFFPLFCLCRFIFAVNHDENIVRESFAVKIRYPSIPYVFCERFYSMWFYVFFPLSVRCCQYYTNPYWTYLPFKHLINIYRE